MFIQYTNMPCLSDIAVQCTKPGEGIRVLNFGTMRNLELLSYRHLDCGEDFQGAEAVCIDYDSGNVFAASPSTIVGLAPQSEQVCIKLLIRKVQNLTDLEQKKQR